VQPPDLNSDQNYETGNRSNFQSSQESKVPLNTANIDQLTADALADDLQFK